MAILISDKKMLKQVATIKDKYCILSRKKKKKNLKKFSAVSISVFLIQSSRWAETERRKFKLKRRHI